MATVTDGAYRDRILGMLGGKDPLESLESTAARVARVVAALGESGLARRYAPDSWTGAQVLAHLADTELGLGFRIRQVLAEKDHRMQGFDQDAWAQRYDGISPQLALRSYLAFREWNLALLRQLTPEDLRREAVHPDRGPESLAVVVRHLAGHELNHLQQLESLLEGA